MKVESWFIEHIKTINELPRNTMMVLYHEPHSAITKLDTESVEEFAVRCSIYEYRQRYGEPGMIYIHRSNIFIVKEE